ncbi:HD-GYP domain-containing protein [Thermotoga sp. SG1]|uniref:HD-GYP domain-containing protein n=1 Tax=Thermotoga sp. SG1 TaxID=126739 RepID=UPI000C792480|nr:HD-GYP domain-containing protein [Thermotoga sp. SG1]PLV55732.1 phosphohydrolase [Thermotoga sp. SG1]
MYLARYRWMFVVSAILIFIGVALVQIHYQKKIERYQLKIFQTIVQRSVDLVSSGYFQWTELKEAIEENDKEFIEEAFEEIKSLDPYIKEIKILDEVPDFEEEYYRIESDGERLWALFKIYDSMGEKMIPDKTAYVEWDMEGVLNSIGASVKFQKGGKKTFWGLEYTSIRSNWFPISFWSSIGGVILIVILHSIFVRSVLRLHYETEGLERLVSIVGKKDHYTAIHSRNVAKIAFLIGKKMGLKRKELKTLEMAGYLHDIGKIAVSEHVLNKSGKLSDEEFEIIKKHPVVGADILKEYSELSHVVPVILYHHERTDGSGYPLGLKNSEIPLLARILAVADVFDALTSDRPYRPAMKPEDALSLIKKMPLDQKIVKILEEHLSEFIDLKPQK